MDKIRTEEWWGAKACPTLRTEGGGGGASLVRPTLEGGSFLLLFFKKEALPLGLL